MLHCAQMHVMRLLRACSLACVTSHSHALHSCRCTHAACRQRKWHRALPVAAAANRGRRTRRASDSTQLMTQSHGAFTSLHLCIGANQSPIRPARVPCVKLCSTPVCQVVHIPLTLVGVQHEHDLIVESSTMHDSRRCSTSPMSLVFLQCLMRARRK